MLAGIFYFVGVKKRMEQLVKMVIDIGLPAVLLLVLFRYFLEMDKGRANQIDELYNQFAADGYRREEQFQEDMKRREKEFRERENILLAETTRREEILKAESEKREHLLRQESDKRESALLCTIESFSVTMKEISLAMNEIKHTTTEVQQKIGSIENVLEEWDRRNDIGTS